VDVKIMKTKAPQEEEEMGNSPELHNIPYSFM